MRIVVVYESVFGNTHRIAAAIERGIRQHASARLVSVGSRAVDDIAAADVVVLGAPTHALSLSTPTTRRQAVDWANDPLRDLTLDSGEPVTGMREWLEGHPHLPAHFVGFDTRAQSMRHFPGSAAKVIDRRLRSRGLWQLSPPTSFYVSSENALLPDEEARAYAWGEHLATTSVVPTARR
jgi:hypothetical protein